MNPETLYMTASDTATVMFHEEAPRRAAEEIALRLRAADLACAETAYVRALERSADPETVRALGTVIAMLRATLGDWREARGQRDAFHFEICLLSALVSAAPQPAAPVAEDPRQTALAL